MAHVLCSLTIDGLLELKNEGINLPDVLGKDHVKVTLNQIDPCIIFSLIKQNLFEID